MLHAFGEALCLFPVFQNPSAQIGVKPDQIIDGGMIGVSFERMWHGDCSF
jgi:hypothetical protein